jgi:transcriptional regulator with XRE-family HTH domain
MKHGPTQTDVLVGSRVRVRRLELGLSQTALANELGVTFQQVQKYEKGTNRIGASRLHAMSRVLGVPVTYFFPAPDPDQPMAKPTEVLNLLSIPGAVDLLRDYAAISDRLARKALVVMARTLARGAAPGVDAPAEQADELAVEVT